jgi:hypothetical protein
MPLYYELKRADEVEEMAQKMLEDTVVGNRKEES